MKKLLFTFYFLLFTFYVKGQLNLVVNPSFEEYVQCPNDYGQIDSAIGWHILINGGGGSPELFNACSTNPNVSVPSNLSNLSFQYAKSGQAYPGIQVIISNQPDNAREYIQSKLVQKLISGNSYCVSFYCNLQNGDLAYIKKMGAYLDNGNVSAPSSNGLAVANPQVYSQQDLSDTLNWMKIEGSFTATGTEEYITIGNFFTDANSGVGFFGTPSFWYTYYFIDDVSVIDMSTPAYAGNDTSIALGDSVFIGRQPEIGLNEDCIWFVNGNPTDTIAGMWVMPDTTTTYVLQQTICGTVNYDTVTVTVVDPMLTKKLNTKDSAFEIYPNPGSGDFSIRLKGSNDNSTVIIYDLAGKIVFQENLMIRELAKINVNLNSGTYMISIRPNNTATKPFNGKVTFVK